MSSNVTTFTLTLEELQREANIVKELFLDQLLKDGIIDNKLYMEMSSYAALLVRKGMFGKLMDKYFNLDKDNKQYFWNFLRTPEPITGDK